MTTEETLLSEFEKFLGEIGKVKFVKKVELVSEGCVIHTADDFDFADQKHFFAIYQPFKTLISRYDLENFIAFNIMELLSGAKKLTVKLILHPDLTDFHKKRLRLYFNPEISREKMLESFEYLCKKSSWTNKDFVDNINVSAPTVCKLKKSIGLQLS